VTGQYFRVGDIRVGEIPTIKGRRFRITGAHEFALNRMEAEAREFPRFDLDGIMN
jgi:hypothetical protein